MTPCQIISERNRQTCYTRKGIFCHDDYEYVNINDQYHGSRCQYFYSKYTEKEGMSFRFIASLDSSIFCHVNSHLYLYFIYIYISVEQTIQITHVRFKATLYKYKISTISTDVTTVQKYTITSTSSKNWCFYDLDLVTQVIDKNKRLFNDSIRPTTTRIKITTTMPCYRGSTPCLSYVPYSVIAQVDFK